MAEGSNDHYILLSYLTVNHEAFVIASTHRLVFLKHRMFYADGFTSSPALWTSCNILFFQQEPFNVAIKKSSAHEKGIAYHQNAKSSGETYLVYSVSKNNLFHYSSQLQHEKFSIKTLTNFYDGEKIALGFKRAFHLARELFRKNRNFRCFTSQWFFLRSLLFKYLRVHFCGHFFLLKWN